MNAARRVFVSHQAFLDLGLNVFAFRLLAEDFSRRRSVDIGLQNVEVVIEFKGKDEAPVFVTLSSCRPEEVGT